MVFLILHRRRKEKSKEQDNERWPRSVRYNSSDDVQISENALYDRQQPSTAMNQLFIGGLPGPRDTALPRLELPEMEPQYARIDRSPKVDSRNSKNPKLTIFRPASGVSDTVELTGDNEYHEIGSAISNPGYNADYDMPNDNKTITGTSIHGDKTESGSVSPYDYIDPSKLERNDEDTKSVKGSYTYLKVINNPGGDSITTDRNTHEYGNQLSTGYTGYANDPSREYANARRNDYLSPSHVAHFRKY